MDNQIQRDQLMAELESMAYAELQKEHTDLQAEVVALRNANNAFLYQAQQFHRSLPENFTMSAEYAEAFEALHDSHMADTDLATNQLSNDAQKHQIETEKLQEVANTLREASKYFQFNPVNSEDLPQEQLYKALNDLQSKFHDHSNMVVSYMAQRNDMLSENAREEIKNLLRPYFSEAADLRQLTSKIVNAVASNLQLDARDVDMLNSELRQPIAAALDASSKVVEEAIEGDKQVEPITEGPYGMEDPFM